MFFIILKLYFYKNISCTENCFYYLFGDTNLEEESSKKDFSDKMIVSSSSSSVNLIYNSTSQNEYLPEEPLYEEIGINVNKSGKDEFNMKDHRLLPLDSFSARYSNDLTEAEVQEENILDKELAVESPVLYKPSTSQNIEITKKIEPTSSSTLENKEKEKKCCIKSIDRVFYTYFSNNFASNILIITGKLGLDNSKMTNCSTPNMKFFYYRNLASTLQKIESKILNSEELELNLIKMINDKINFYYQGILNMITFKELKSDLRGDETSLEDDTKKIRMFNQFVIDHIGSYQIIANIYRVNFKVLIKKELKKFIKQYKNMPEILNFEIFLREVKEYGYKACTAYIYLKLMNLTLQDDSINDGPIIYGVLYRAIIVLSCKYKRSLTKLKTPKNIENSCFGMISLCLDIIDYSLRDDLIYKMEKYNSTKLYSSLLYNKKISFRIFLLMNIYLFNNCEEGGSKDSCSLTNILNLYISNFHSINRDEILKISLLIYNYLMYGNSTFPVESMRIYNQ